MFFVYVLKSLKDGRFYTGQTKDLNRRLAEHNAGRANFTRHHGPYELIHFETYDSRTEAMQREIYLKTGKGREELEKLGL